MILTILIVISVIVVGFLLFWRLWFLRLPNRRIPSTGIVSPANGKLMRIIEFKNGKAKTIPKGLWGKVEAVTTDIAREGYILVIMLTPIHVHYQRAPVSGKILSITYKKGGFHNVVSGKASIGAFENEHNSILFQAGKERIKVVQVAGCAARRIECFVKQKQQVKKGVVIGLINFGSQTLLVLPKKRLRVTQGQEMIDGETVIA